MPDQWTVAYWLLVASSHAGQFLAAMAVAGAVWAGWTWARRVGRARTEGVAAAVAATPIEVEIEIGSGEDWDRLYDACQQEGSK